MVGQLKANPNGLKDMHGNVAEWVEDCFHINYARAPRTEQAWTSGGNCQHRVVRGGSWRSDLSALRSGSRDFRLRIDEGRDDTGFRIARGKSSAE